MEDSYLTDRLITSVTFPSIDKNCILSSRTLRDLSTFKRHEPNRKWHSLSVDGNSSAGLVAIPFRRL